MRRLLYIAFLVPLLVAAETDTSQEARRWLDRMVEAVKTLDYEGTFVYLYGDQLEAMHIVHTADENGERERLLSLNGAAREIIRDENVLTCILPDEKAVVVEKSRPRKYIPQGLLEPRNRLERFYSLATVGEDRVAGRPAQIIAIEPRDGYRYGYRLWLDQETGMLLKSDLTDLEGRSVEQMMFTNLEFDPDIQESRLKPRIAGEGYKWFRQEQPGHRADKSPWVVTKLPPGYAMSMYVEHGMPTSKMPVEHMLFTDGLSSVSVYIEKPEQSKNPLKGVSRMGAVNAYGAMVSGHQVTVVGEVPQATVMMIGKSVRFKPQP